MNKFFTILVVLFAFVSAQSVIAQEEKPLTAPDGAPILLVFDEDVLSLGDVKKGDKIHETLFYTNKSKEDVTIEFISTCSCTEVEYETDPIKPGEKGEIKFVFDSGKKDKDEEIVLDILLANTDPKTGYPIVQVAKYTYHLIGLE